MIDIFPYLDKALLSLPRSRDVERVWKILEARRLNPDKSPPLKVLVMGGSVAEGVGCNQELPSKGDEPEEITGRDCNWSMRLEQFVNTALGYEGVEIVNIAQGGTATDQALTLIKVNIQW